MFIQKRALPLVLPECEYVICHDTSHPNDTKPVANIFLFGQKRINKKKFDGKFTLHLC